jgi:myo-inositol-1(or 4)-monophosphatase
MDTNLNVREIRDYLLDLLPRAGQILRRYFHAEELPSRKKGIHDFVTAADLAVDKFLQGELLKKYPEIPIMTEETVKGDISRFSRAPLIWIIDPLDGTANFARGDVNFSISVALVRYGNPLLGVIFAPISSRLFWAVEGEKSAYWNGRKIHVSKVEELAQATVCTDWSHILETRDDTTAFLRSVYGHVRQIKILGSAATDITLLARGGVDIYHHVRLFPWDVAAAGLIAKNAGATVTDTDGTVWNAFSKGILAANPILHKEIQSLVH